MPQMTIYIGFAETMIEEEKANFGALSDRNSNPFSLDHN